LSLESEKRGLHHNSRKLRGVVSLSRDVDATLAVEGAVRGDECGCLFAIAKTMLRNILEREAPPLAGELWLIEQALAHAVGDDRATAIEVLSPYKPSWLLVPQ